MPGLSAHLVKELNVVSVYSAMSESGPSQLSQTGETGQTNLANWDDQGKRVKYADQIRPNEPSQAN